MALCRFDGRYRGGHRQDQDPYVLGMWSKWDGWALHVANDVWHPHSSLGRKRLKCEFESEVGPDNDARGMGHVSLVLLDKARAA